MIQGLLNVDLYNQNFGKKLAVAHTVYSYNSAVSYHSLVNCCQ